MQGLMHIVWQALCEPTSTAGAISWVNFVTCERDEDEDPALHKHCSKRLLVRDLQEAAAAAAKRSSSSRSIETSSMRLQNNCEHLLLCGPGTLAAAAAVAL
jgi:hypothetical protein